MINLLTVTIEIFLLSIFLLLFFKSYYTNTVIQIVLFLIPVFIIYEANRYMSTNINAIISFMTYIFIAIFWYNGILKYKIFFVIVFYSFCILSDFFTNIFIQFIFDINLDTIRNHDRYMFYANIFSKLIVFISLCIIYSIRKKSHTNLEENSKYAFTLAVLPISTILILLGVFKLLNDFEKIGILVYFGVTGLIIANFYIYYLFNKVIWTNIRDKEFNYLKEINSLNHNYYQMLEENYNAKKALSHDFKKHLDMINYLIDENDQISLKNYMMSLNQKSFAIQQNFTGIKVLDIIINSKFNYITSYNINLKLDITMNLSLEFMDIVDQNILFSNLFDNCIENTVQASTKFISIKIKKINLDTIVIKFINTSDKLLKNIDYFNLESTKPDKENHGLGTKIILKIINKYNGKLICETDENNKLFITTIVFITS